MDSRARTVVKIGDKLFGAKAVMDSLWQEIALNFYPDRADFTNMRHQGDEYSDHLFSSYPVLARRELANLIPANLRPESNPWLGIETDNEKINENRAAREYMDYLAQIQWRAMYDPAAQLVKAAKEADHDFVTFGNSVKRVSKNVAGDGLLFASRHLRDCAWSENGESKVDNIHVNLTLTARQLKHYFGDKVSADVKKACEKDPEKPFKCRHVVLPSREYEYKTENGRQFPFTSLYVERESENILEEVGQNTFGYVIPRWMTVSGSAYGRSMATSIALPDGRTMQVITRTMREAGEKYVDPPMVAVADAIRGDMNVYAGGVTIADMEYDERLGDVLRPISQDRGGMPIGFELQQALREDIRHAFMLDKIQLPEVGGDMTAFEVQRRLNEHIRQSSPIFEPIQQEDNTPLCEEAFALLMEGGAFPVEEMPEELQGKDIKFKFTTPLSDMAEQNKSSVYMQVRDQIIMPAAQIDPAQIEQFDFTTSTREAAIAAGWEAKWLKDPEVVDQKRQEMQQQAQMQQEMAMAGQAATVMEQGGKAAKEIEDAG